MKTPRERVSDMLKPHTIMRIRDFKIWYGGESVLL